MLQFLKRFASPPAPAPESVADYVDRVLAVVAKHASEDQLHAMAAELTTLPPPAVLTKAAPALPQVGAFAVIRVDKTDPLAPPIVYGWGSVVTEQGTPVEDKQGDIIDIFELRGAVHEFIAKSRNVGEMHQTFGHGDVVDSFVLPQEVQRALGFDLGREGWIVGVRVTNPRVAKRVRSGELKAFSLGGSGIREDA